ncbi:MAG TPA: addiction module protein [Gemmataceae bacterium]|jgi:putative addiction module component (TIGR02574 family)
MTPTMKDLGIDRLSVADRLALVQEIWDSIAADPESVPLTEDLKRVLDRRCADLDANSNDVLTWEEIKARIRERLGPTQIG